MAHETDAAPFLARWLDQAGQRGDLYAPDCPARAVLEHMTSRWGVLVLVTLLSGPRRFGELKQSLSGVSDKMLTRTLKDLRRDGLVRRTSRYEDPPVIVDYHLTALGTEAARLIAQLTDWINDNLHDIHEARRHHDLAPRDTERPPQES
ncbi:MAG TPA: helix-turn-helix domain-containing protein [Pseudonocardiaceae bacterium]|nr:helix-turn-helix domain-containing protein [Pseudonocardiaceae bacterium]